jgi:WD40 repeat protein
VAFDAESKIVASAGLDGTVKLWSIDGHSVKTLSGHQGAVNDIALCQKTNLFVSGSSDKTAKLWQLDGTLLKTFEANDAIIGVDCSENGEYIATSGLDNAVTIWKADGTFLKTLKEHGASGSGCRLEQPMVWWQLLAATMVLRNFGGATNFY